MEVSHMDLDMINRLGYHPSMARFQHFATTWFLLLVYAVGGIAISPGVVFCEEVDGDTRILLSSECSAERGADDCGVAEAPCEDGWEPCGPCDSPCTDRPMVQVNADVPRTKNKACKPASECQIVSVRFSNDHRKFVSIPLALPLFYPPISCWLEGSVKLNV